MSELGIEEAIIGATNAQKITGSEHVQSLWSGYGEIKRYNLARATYPSVIVKTIDPPKVSEQSHPRGWNTNTGHHRKIKSYQVEKDWYTKWADQCDSFCRVPHLIFTKELEQKSILILEDLNASGFPLRKQALTQPEIENCLTWLASFHSKFLGSTPTDLWEVGTYWHLDTRKEEWEQIDNRAIKSIASKIDQKLNRAQFQTIVHGDAKVANFCFPEDDLPRVSAVDFQYAGGGCGMKDLVYFLGSCLNESECEKNENVLLDLYFDKLHQALVRDKKDESFEALEQEWRSLYRYAWTDFYRFLLGWSPGHWKINPYSEKLAKRVIQEIS